MCGPADYAALQMLIYRAAELSLAGLTAGMVRRAVKFFKDRQKNKANLRSPCTPQGDSFGKDKLRIIGGALES